jgi:hypothetical protein
MTNTKKNRATTPAGASAGWAWRSSLAAVAYSAGWYWLAGQVDTQATGFVEEQRGQGLAIDCADRDVRGYPFRLEIFCTSLDMARPGRRPDRAGRRFPQRRAGLRAARVYAELDAPVTVDKPPDRPGQGDWTLGRATATLAEPLPSASLSVDNLDMAFAGLRKGAVGGPCGGAYAPARIGNSIWRCAIEGLVVDPVSSPAAFAGAFGRRRSPARRTASRWRRKAFRRCAAWRAKSIASPCC